MPAGVVDAVKALQCNTPSSSGTVNIFKSRSTASAFLISPPSQGGDDVYFSKKNIHQGWCGYKLPELINQFSQAAVAVLQV